MDFKNWWLYTCKKNWRNQSAEILKATKIKFIVKNKQTKKKKNNEEKFTILINCYI